jgi:hypothetical protein
MKQQQNHFAFESLLIEAFINRDLKKSQWAEGLVHLVSHEQIPHVALHHQHDQYHQVLFCLENLFPQAAQWIGARELARLVLDFIENNPKPSEKFLTQAESLVEFLSTKRSFLHVAQLESLLRCGMACWKIRSAKWRPDVVLNAKEKNFSFMTLIECNQAAFIESSGPWSIYDLWTSASSGKMIECTAERDVILFLRKDEFNLDFEKCSVEQLKKMQDF